MSLAVSRFLVVLCLAGGSIASDPAIAQIPCRYDVQIIPDLNCGVWHSPVTAVAISNTGIVIASFGGCESWNDSAWWNGGPNLHLLPRPAGVNDIDARDVSDNGLIVGQMGFQVGLQTRYKGFVYVIATG